MLSTENPEPTGEIATDVAPPGPRPIPAVRLWALTLGTSLAAGLLAWGIGEKNLTYFVPPTVKVTAMGATFDMVTRENQAAVDRKNAMLAFGVLGGLLGLALGLAGGLSRGSVASGATAGLVGSAVGVAAGAAGSWALLGIYFHQELNSFEEFSRDLLLPTLIRGGISAIIGSAAGLALGLGAGADRRQILSGVLGGLIGGLIGATLYEIAGAWLFPTADSNRPIPGAWPPRLLAMLLPAALIGACAAFTLLAPGRRGRERPTAAEPTAA
ncbi:hypothetical protein [Paludisphaera soli]|uniref:hypothetical protein n=1 Tax=Paludisphaera soli TaxID=2712865 RepID=UPI0013EA8C09|nr:hypothetical protein [Paludisphaera soli]